MGTIRLPQDFKEFTALLNQKHVEYLSVGGFAVAYHSFPRATFDIDFLLAFNPENINKLIYVLKEFGFGFKEIFKKEFWEKTKNFRMGENRNNLLCLIY